MSTRKNIPLTKPDSLVNNRKKIPNPFIADKDGHMTFRSPIQIKNKKYKRAFVYFFLLIVILESAWVWVQGIQSWSTQSTEDVSLVSLIIVTFTNTIWLLYALLIVPETPILVSAILVLTGAIIALTAKITYG